MRFFFGTMLWLQIKIDRRSSARLWLFCSADVAGKTAHRFNLAVYGFILQLWKGLFHIAVKYLRFTHLKKQNIGNGPTNGNLINQESMNDEGD